jgi:hypothetical protein
MTISIMGHEVEVVTDKVCQRSPEDHVKLKHEARADRAARGFNVNESFVLCGRCGKAVSLA